MSEVCGYIEFLLVIFHRIEVLHGTQGDQCRFRLLISWLGSSLYQQFSQLIHLILDIMAFITAVLVVFFNGLISV